MMKELTDKDYSRIKGLKRELKRALKQNGFKVLIQDMALLEVEESKGLRYVMLLDKATTYVYRMYYSEKYLTEDHWSLWEVDRVPSQRVWAEIMEENAREAAIRRDWI